MTMHLNRTSIAINFLNNLYYFTYCAIQALHVIFTDWLMNQISWIFDIAISTPIPIVYCFRNEAKFRFFSGNTNDWETKMIEIYLLHKLSGTGLNSTTSDQLLYTAVSSEFRLKKSLSKCQTCSEWVSCPLVLWVAV